MWKPVMSSIVLKAALLACVLVSLSSHAFSQKCQGGKCQSTFRAWSVESDSSSVIASTSAETGGFLAYMCKASAPDCRWGVVMPDADCTPDENMQVSLVGDQGSLITNSKCGLLDSHGQGRTFLFNTDLATLTRVLTGDYVTVSVRKLNRAFIQHRFSGDGAGEATSTARESYFKLAKANESGFSEGRHSSDVAVRSCIRGTMDSPTKPGAIYATALCSCLAQRLGWGDHGVVLPKDPTTMDAIRSCSVRALQLSK